MLGYVGAINDTEYKTLKNDGYTLEDQVGKDGVEKIFEKDLRGTPGSITLEVDSAGRVLRELTRTDAIPGRDVQLTIDLRVQALAEDSLATALLNARTRTPKDNPNHFAAPGGSVVVLDPTTGAVVAMASYPTFDPREFVGGVDPDRYKQLLDPTNNFPLTNRAIAGQYAPGSTFKMITAAAGLAVGVISSGTRFLDAGHYTVPDCKGEKCTFSNAGGEQNGWVTMPTALAASSDVYFYSIGADLWRFRDQYNLAIQDTATAYGFGAETGVPLPGEQEGRVPTPEQKQAAHDQNPTAFPFGQWFTGDNVNLAVGQGDMLDDADAARERLRRLRERRDRVLPEHREPHPRPDDRRGHGAPRRSRDRPSRASHAVAAAGRARSDPVGADRSGDLGERHRGARLLHVPALPVPARGQDRHRADRGQGSAVRHVAVRRLRPGRLAEVRRRRRARAVGLRRPGRRSRRTTGVREPRWVHAAP